MQSARKLRQRIDSQTLTTGVLAIDHIWIELVEICALAGLDYLIVDMEHGAHDPSLIVDVCAVGRMIDFPVLIRPINHEINTIRKAIDMGACGLLLPTINTTAQLDEVRDAIYLPPRGQRRPGGLGNRWVTGLTYNHWKTEVEDDLIILPQIETQVGLSNVDAIAAHEIVTAMAHGPYDLSADLGVCGQTTGPEVTAATAQVRDAARRAGKNMWVIGDGPSLTAQGYSFICIGEPSAMLQNVMRQTVEQTKK
jgi:4-hydroxy-2-oxoheptanedioate aldolase